jgi:hypothetical protein
VKVEGLYEDMLEYDFCYFFLFVKKLSQPDSALKFEKVPQKLKRTFFEIFIEKSRCCVKTGISGEIFFSVNNCKVSS